MSQTVAAGIKEFRALLDASPSEQDAQLFLASHVYFWNGLLRFHGTLYQQVRLGSEYRVDFAFYDPGSDGAEWHLVEIEAPSATIFNSRGDPSGSLNRAISQIREWQGWISRNHAAADRVMPGIFHPFGHIFIGRRSEILTPRLRERLKDLNTANRASFKINTFDRFVDMAGSVRGIRPIPFGPAALSDHDLRHNFPAGELEWIRSAFGSSRDFYSVRKSQTVYDDEQEERSLPRPRIRVAIDDAERGSVHRKVPRRRPSAPKFRPQ
jgi:diadenosine tetraphosphatase ApaH/serine/threonine PP2A family protein phosphatase